MQNAKDQPSATIKGRGASGNPQGRFERWQRVAESEEPGAVEDEAGSSAPRTQVWLERAKSIVTRNTSPDLPFRLGLNPYRGCEHGCIYCYARPTHSYLGLSPGLDFETRLVAKTNAPELLRAFFARQAACGERAQAINLGSATDIYQPIERRFGLTRTLLQIFNAHRHPITLITKNALVERDIDLLAEAAQAQRAMVCITLPTLRADLARIMEPRASAPARRLQAMARLSAAGIPVAVSLAPMIAFINDDEMEAILSAARAAGARWAFYALLRLPWELRELFENWLRRHFAQRAERVLATLGSAQGERISGRGFFERMGGTGHYADLLAQRFALASRRLGFDAEPLELDFTRFRVPRDQGELFAD